ncbi:asparaginase [Paenibacillus glycanilyticus]|uniref:asparaginase n=1 Tax=Paenibacillus glycanilyticus TaxID=126569 RepID=A0ABQ6GL19_9BACL|nr:asparaginase [Paenibacillus glycanilyticus]GLX70046.1 L-asparaginase 1 [Paenibacillus glycanilyticus]
MSQILVMFTGGTIGSKNNNGAISVNEAGSYHLIDAYMASPLKREVDLETVQPMNILSENIVPSDWNALIAAIRAVDQTKYDGIIVTHGSDTLAYSAALLSFVMSDLTIPLVLVASNYPLGDERANGLSNFAGAINLISEDAAPGVFVVYRNDKGESVVYLGSRITQCESFTDQFDSPYSVPYGMMAEGRLVRYDHPYNPTQEELRLRQPSGSPWVEDGEGIQPGMLYIRPFPGMSYSYYDFTVHKPKAVLHDLFHSGTANASGTDSYSLLRFAQYCAEHGVDLYLCPLKDKRDAMYASSIALLEAGAVFIENMSIEAALMKLTLAYSLPLGKEEIHAYVMEQPVFYEFVANRGKLGV